MSEDEEDFLSEEEWLAFDDGDRELADELVLDTIHSPIYLDDLAVDAALDDSDSDWEWEYFDNYFDEDPSALPKSAISQHTLSGRGGGRKRKRATVEDDRSHASVDPTTFEGTVWRNRAHDSTPARPFEPGKYKQFALMKNWRDVVKKPQADKIRVLGITGKPSSAPERSGNVNGRDASKAANQPPPSVPHEGGRTRKKTKVDTAPEVSGNRDRDADDYESDGDEDEDRPAHELPPFSLVSTDDIPKKQNNRKNMLAPKRGKRPPSRLKEAVSAEETQQEGPPATVPAVESKKAVSESDTASRPEGDSLPKENASRGKKRKASEHTDQADHKVNGETTGRPTARRKLQSQSKEQQASEPSRRSLRQKKTT